MKLPDNDPPRVTQAEEVTKSADELENSQDVSVGRKPVPRTEMSKPTRAVTVLKAKTGCDRTVGKMRLPADVVVVNRRSRASTNFKEERKDTGTEGTARA